MKTNMLVLFALFFSLLSNKKSSAQLLSPEALEAEKEYTQSEIVHSYSNLDFVIKLDINLGSIDQQDLFKAIPRCNKLQQLRIYSSVYRNSDAVLEEFVKRCPNLQVLNTDIKLRHFPKAITQLKHLIFLRSEDSLVHPEEDLLKIAQIKSLKKLSLFEIGFKNLPPEISQLTNLEELSLETGLGDLGNKIPTWQFPSRDLPIIYKLTNLRSLSLGFNNIRSIPIGIESLKKLKTFYCNYAKLESLPDGFGQLTNLETLSLDGNSLSSLPTSFGNLVKLEKLDLSDNPLAFLPPSFGKLKNLKSLSLAACPKLNWDLEAGKLKKMDSLQTLSLRESKLNHVPEDFFLLSHIMELNLSDNNITSIPEINASHKKDILVYLVNTPLAKDTLEQNRIEKANPGINFWYEYQCFPAGTLITMADGSLKEIEKIKKGELVMGYSLAGKKQIAVSVERTRVFDKQPHRLMEVSFDETPPVASLVGSSAPDVFSMKLSPYHPVFTKERGWIQASEIKPGYTVLYCSSTSAELREIKVKTVDQIKETVPVVYNIKTGSGNYFANGILVHNK